MCMWWMGSLGYLCDDEQVLDFIFGWACIRGNSIEISKKPSLHEYNC